MKTNILDITGKEIKLGDKVQILKITDDSGNASDLYDVEPHLDGWVDIVYIEEFEGIVEFDEEKLMVVIKGKRKSIPLSKFIRYNIWDNLYERLESTDLYDILKELNLSDNELETIINYIKIV